MITFLILATILVIVVATVIAIVAIGGGMFAILFGDLIVCALILVWIIKRLIKRRK